jgi:hypothetical protein
MSKEQVKFVQDCFYDILLHFKRWFKIETKKPSLLCHSLARLESMTWVERATANGTILDYKAR